MNQDRNVSARVSDTTEKLRNKERHLHLLYCHSSCFSRSDYSQRSFCRYNSISHHYRYHCHQGLFCL